MQHLCAIIGALGLLSACSSGAAGKRGATDVASAGSVAGEGRSTNSTPPATLLDLTNWKLTLPIGDQGKPTEVKGPALRTFTADPYFHLNAAGDAVVFQANAGGVTTAHSKYPRSELREMANGGTENAAWSTTEGKHSLTLTAAITHLPEAKPHVVAAQIHDASDDVIMVRLERKHLFVEGGGSELGDLDREYELGTPFTVKIEAQEGHIRVYHNDMARPKVDIERPASGCYFKAGVYTQSNTSKGDSPSAYGEVVIKKLAVNHG
jgi:Alginate lyase